MEKQCMFNGKNLNVLLFFSLFLTFTEIRGELSLNEEDDNLTLAESALDNGDLEKSEFFLGKALAKLKKGEQAKYNFLSGRLTFNRDQYESSYTYFKNVENNSGDFDLDSLHRYLALVSFALEKFKEALDYSSLCAEFCLNDPQMVVIRSQSAWKTQQKDRAWREINAGLIKFREHPALSAQKFSMLLDDNLIYGAELFLNEWMKNIRIFPQNKKYALAMVASTEKVNAPNLSIKLLEFLHLSIPDDDDFSMLLTKKYFALDQFLAAAQILEPIVLKKNKYNALLAELYRRGHHYVTAFSYIERINEPKEKLEQLLAINLEQENYAMILSLESKINYHGLSKSDEIKYILAYAHYENHDFENSKKYLQQITDIGWFSKSSELRSAIISCTSGDKICF